MTVPVAGTVTGNVVEVVMPDGNSTEVSVVIEDVFVRAVIVAEKACPGEMLIALGDAVSRR